MSISSVARETAMQFIGGVAIGTALDAMFPDSHEVNSLNIMVEIGSAALQLGLNGFLAAAFYDFTARKGDGDPSNGIGFTITLVASQPMLMKRLGHISNYVKEHVGRPPALMSMPDQQMKSSKPGYIAMNLKPTNSDVPAGVEDEMGGFF